MKKTPYHINLNDLPTEKINHGEGKKCVFINNNDTQTSLTQFAWSKFKSNQSCKTHSHPTMDEYFFVLKRFGIYIINDIKIKIKQGDFIRIPANTTHKLYLENNQKNLELIYFGIATNN